MNDKILQRFTVTYEYPVRFTRGAFHPGNPVVGESAGAWDGRGPQRVAVFVDDGLAAASPSVAPSAAAYFRSRPERFELTGEPERVPGGERAKRGRETLDRVIAAVAGRRLCRHSLVVAVGGGSMLDVVGLAAALVHRGLRLLRVPSTTLAQADSGVGVKNGIDGDGVKNLLGVFAPPTAVVIDFDFLQTLPWPYWIGGVAEAFKVAVIRDAAFFARLADAAPRLRARDEVCIEAVIRETARLHLAHIREGGDPFESGASRPLDFGHWCAHKLEILSDYTLGHGQSVAIGMAVDAAFACRAALLTRGERDAFLGALRSAGLPVWDPLLEQRRAGGGATVLDGIEEFREHMGGPLTVVMPDGIGRCREVHAMPAGEVEAALRDVWEWAGAA